MVNSIVIIKNNIVKLYQLILRENSTQIIANQVDAKLREDIERLKQIKNQEKKMQIDPMGREHRIGDKFYI